MDHQLHGERPPSDSSAVGGIPADASVEMLERSARRRRPGTAAGRARSRRPVPGRCSSRSPWKSRDEIGTPPGPVAQGPVERAELGEPAPRRIDHRRAAGHRLAGGAVAGLGDDRVGRGDQVAAGPVGRRDDVQVGSARRPARGGSRRNGSLARPAAPDATSRGRLPISADVEIDEPVSRPSGRAAAPARARRSRPWLTTMPTSIGRLQPDILRPAASGRAPSHGGKRAAGRRPGGAPRRRGRRA